METSTPVPRRKLGTQGLEVSALGLGCSGLSGAYGFYASEKDAISLFQHAFSNGITFFDTADVYGRYTNEILVGKALKCLPREKIQLATKFGMHLNNEGQAELLGTAEYVRNACENSLQRLGMDYIDLYCQHRVDKRVPIEETSAHPRFQPENLEKNKIIFDRVSSLANRHNSTPAQLALAWVIYQGDDVVPIPGTTKTGNLDDNIGSLSLKFSDRDVEEITNAVPEQEIAGPRCSETEDRDSWKFATTPPKEESIN